MLVIDDFSPSSWNVYRAQMYGAFLFLSFSFGPFIAAKKMINFSAYLGALAEMRSSAKWVSVQSIWYDRAVLDIEV